MTSPLTFSKRQTEILELIDAGKTNRQISEILFLSEHTIKVHLWRLYNKIGVHNRGTALALWRASKPAPSPCHAGHLQRRDRLRHQPGPRSRHVPRSMAARRHVRVA